VVTGDCERTASLNLGRTLEAKDDFACFAADRGAISRRRSFRRHSTVWQRGLPAGGRAVKSPQCEAALDNSKTVSVLIADSLIWRPPSFRAGCSGCLDLASLDANLQRIIEACARLPEVIRKAMLELIGVT
jgi:hypothetical protein